MKTRLLLPILIGLFMTNLSFSQTPISRTIEVDFKKINEPNLTTVTKIKEGDFYNIKITGVNPNRYDIVINSKDTLLTPKLDMPNFKDFSLDVLTKLTNSFATTANVSASLPTLESSNNLLYQVGVNYAYMSIPIPVNPSIGPTIDNYSISVRDFKETLVGIKLNFDKVKMEFYKYRMDNYKKIIPASAYNVDQAFLSFENVRNSLTDFQSKVSDFQKDFDEFSNRTDVKAFISNVVNSASKTKFDNITKANAEMILKINEFIEIVSANNIEAMLKTIIFLENSNDFITLPIQFRKEQAKVTIKFVPKADVKVQAESMVFYFPAVIESYWSVGSSFYFANNMKNERFSTIGAKDANDNTFYTIKKEEDVNEEFGISLMMRYGEKRTNREYSNLGYHFSFGPGVSMEKNVRPRLLIGGGISLGSKHNLTIDAGLIAGYVERLSSAIDLTTQFSESPDVTVTKLDYSPYFSIGYMYKLN